MLWEGSPGMATGLGQFTYGYDPTRGLLQTVNFPNGEAANYTYYGVNNDLRLNTLQRKLGATEIFFEKYTYADNGNLLTRLKRSLGVPGQTLSYTYDSADQLLSVSNPKDASNYPQSYAYDPAGNLTTATTPSGSRSFTYNSLNERTTDAGVAQQFDANGNLSTGMGFTFTWDAEDRLKSLSYNGTQKRIEYDYDGLGRRVRIRSMDNGVKTAEYLYVWDGLQLCEKRDSAVETFPVAIYYPQGERKFLSGTYLNYFLPPGPAWLRARSHQRHRLDHPELGLSALRTALSAAARRDRSRLRLHRTPQMSIYRSDARSLSRSWLRKLAKSRSHRGGGRNQPLQLRFKQPGQPNRSIWAVS